MRPVFEPEVAQHLGYQKHWPEKKDWALAIAGCLGVTVLFVGVICGVLMLTGNWDRQFIPKTCADYGNYSINDMPAKCISYFTGTPDQTTNPTTPNTKI